LFSSLKWVYHSAGGIIIRINKIQYVISSVKPGTMFIVSFLPHKKELISGVRVLAFINHYISMLGNYLLLWKTLETLKKSQLLPSCLKDYVHNTGNMTQFLPDHQPFDSVPKAILIEVASAWLVMQKEKKVCTGEQGNLVWLFSGFISTTREYPLVHF
jgi:hypothetical protein